MQLAENIKKFISPETDREAMGRNARRYYEENFREALFMDKLESNFMKDRQYENIND
jgi:hypothetical protein